MPGRSASRIAPTARSVALIGLDRSRELDRLLRVDEREALGRERRGRARVDALDPDAHATAAELPDQPRGLRGPAPLALRDPGAGGDEAGGERRPHLVDRLQAVREVHAARELEQQHRPVDGDQQVSRRVAEVVDLHVARAGRVADVDRVEQQAGGDVPLGHPHAHALEPVTPERLEIDLLGRRLAVDQPERRQVRPVGVPVEIHRGHVTDAATASADPD
jgi:hypothetical protein